MQTTRHAGRFRRPDRILQSATCLALITASVAAGCGPGAGPIKRDELERGVKTLAAVSAAGKVLTEGVIADSTKTTVVRVNARELSEEATHEAEKLQDAEAAGPVVGFKSEAVTIAQQIAAALGDLQVAAKDPDVARDVRQRLEELGHRADRLAVRI
ncbi:MAG TPA: hypothetical protein VNT22_09125 [Baekduia sp.]|nr:hypothetical protein [Baekduia sp.]